MTHIMTLAEEQAHRAGTRVNQALAAIQVIRDGVQYRWVISKHIGTRIERIERIERKLREDYDISLKATIAQRVDNITRITENEHIDNNYSFEEIVTEYLTGVIA